ncbi:hypothetical protein [Paraburkholderia sp. CI3]|uniref:hypothetical protein n=1 Tax=Paraburkholderia sp. CI3 TaxID=2991060 RepID=UPI003D24744A
MARQAVLIGEPPFAGIQKLRGWPKTNAIVEQGRRTSVRDKGEPEGAVAFAHADGRKGKLSLQWAVFLPTDEERFCYQAAIPGGSREYSIALHGQFFVDAGRRGIEGIEQITAPVVETNDVSTESAVQLAWNQSLAQRVVLPMLLPALDEYVRTECFDDATIEDLTYALTRCAPNGAGAHGEGFIATFGSHVCRERAWARVLRPRGPEWKLLVAGADRLLPLPRPLNNDHGRPWRALPGLNALGGAVFPDATAPCISDSVPQWDEDSVCRVIDEIPAATLAGEVELRYLLEFLRMHESVALAMEHVQVRLVVALRRALSGLHLAELRNNRALFQEVTGLLRPSLRFGIGARDKDARRALPEEIYRRLLDTRTDALLIPADLAPEGGAPSASDVQQWLECLGALIEEGVNMASCLDAADAFIRAGGPNEEAQHDLLRRRPRLRILRATNAADAAEVACSLNALLDLHRHHLLFRTADGIDKLGLTSTLARAVPGLGPMVVGRFVGELVRSAHDSGKREVPRTNEATEIFRAIGMQAVAPALGKPAERTPLLRRVADADADLTIAPVREGVRYLLHGSAAQFRSDESLWKDPSGEDGPWVRLWRMVETDSWKVLDVTLSRHLTDHSCFALKVRPVDQQTVTEHLRRLDHFDDVDAKQFSDSDLDMLLGAIKDEAVWVNLPLHRDERREFGTAHNCFLGREPLLPPGFEHGLRFIVESEDEAHKRRQHACIPSWSAAEAGRVLLNSKAPAAFWSELMELLPLLGKGEISGAWTDVSWLPLASGGTIAHSSLVRIDTMRMDLSALAAECEYAYASLDDLQCAVRDHPCFDQLKEHVPSGVKALDVLAQMMGNAGYFVGRAGRLDAGALDRLRGVLPSLQSLPAWSVLYKAASATSITDAATLLGEIAQSLPVARVEAVLAELADQVQSPQVLEAGLIYLREWARSASPDELRSRLPAVRLPAADGTWRAASELVAGAFGINASSQLHKEALPILSDLVIKNDGTLATPIASATTGGNSNADLGAALERWCEPLAESNVGQAIGALLGLFGSAARPLCERWIGSISYSDYLLRLNWKDPGFDKALNRKEWMGGHISPQQPFAILKPEFVESSGSEVHVLALTGDELVLPLTEIDSMSTLLAGKLNWLGGYGVEVRMRPMECLRRFDEAQQKQILQRTAEELFEHLYNQKRVDLTELWGLFEKSDQIELEVARSLILEGLPTLVHQWPAVKKHPSIDEAIKLLDKARRERQSALSARTDSRDCEDRLVRALNELARRVETDESAQHAILTAIRRKLQHFHYEASSVPFELLQNADDAVLELQTMQDDEGRERYAESEVGRFVVACTATSVLFMHWGRPINTSGKRGGYREDHAKDLERMLVLNASGKDEDDGLTGKFGLGFKSVFLVSDEPVIESGGLHFEIVAGCLPQRAELSEGGRLVTAPYRQTQGSLRSTVVELPLRLESANGLLERFAALAGVCAAFTQEIRHVEVDGETYDWRPKRLLEAPGAQCEVGDALLPHARGLSRGSLLVLRCPFGAMAMRLDGQPVPFEGNAAHPAPAIWVNSPTRGMPAAGLILNARFDIDTGRGSLPQGAGAKTNLEIATRLADALAPLVTELLTQTRENWPSWSRELAVPPQTSPAEFWYGFWSQAFGDAPSDDASQDARVTETFASTLFSRVVARSGVVPNGLKAGLAAFVRVEQLRLSIAYDRFNTLLPTLLGWPPFTAAFPPVSWCVREVRDWLQRRPGADDDASVDELSRVIVAQALGSSGKVSPEEFVRLAAVVKAWPLTNVMELGWRTALSSIQLRAQSGAWKTAANLFTRMSEDDPLRRLASPDFLPDTAYETDAEAWETMQEYLDGRTWLAQEIARWCVGAETVERQKAAIAWLAANLNSDFVWRAIRSSPLKNEWITGLHAEHALLADLPDRTRSFMLSSLGLSQDGADDDEIELDDPAAQLDFNIIHDWWEAHRDEHLPKYERELWPQRIDRQRLADDPTHRETWMTLFSLGVFRRFGRVRDAQNRGFLDFLEQRGWWYTISQLDPDSAAEEWMAILREYAETTHVSNEFELWMDCFPRLYRVARWFETYVELFRGLQYRDAREAAHLLTPATDASLSGSGIDAATLSGTLRVGHHLVIRELLRAGVLDTEVAQSMAFMPGKSVCALLDAMGHIGLDTSAKIHEALVDELGDVDRASFCGDFDIPLILLAHDAGLQRDVVRWSTTRDERGAWETEEGELL